MTDLTEREPDGVDVADVADVAAVDEGPTRAPSHATWALVLICIAQLMVVLDATIANIALPYIGNDLAISGTSLSWIVTGYSLAFGGLLLLGGRLGDYLGRRNIFMAGVIVFGLASALGGAAQNEAMLLTARGLQGLGAAMASPTALALITTTFPAGPQRNRAFSVFAAMAGVGAAIGLILGGWLTGIDPNWGWRLTFLINVPIGLGAAALAPLLLPESERDRGRLDVRGAILGTVGLLSLVYGITRTGQQDSAGQTNGWSDPIALVSIALAVVLLVSFVVVEMRTRHALMPLSIFANRNRATAFLAMMLVPAAMFAMFYFLSLYIQNIMGYSPLKTGFAFLPFCFGIIFGSGLASVLVARIDARFIAGTGTALAGLSLFMFHRLNTFTASDVARVANGGHLGDTVSFWTQVMPWIVVMSAGMGLTFVPMTLVAVHGVRKEDAGIGSGVLNTMQQVGGALGLAVLSTVAAHFSTPQLASIGAQVQSSGGSASRLGQQIYFAAFSHGAVSAFLVGAFMIWAGTVAIVAFMNVTPKELATDEAPPGVGG